jgi:hypothetical protein
MAIKLPRRPGIPAAAPPLPTTTPSNATLARFGEQSSIAGPQPLSPFDLQNKLNSMGAGLRVDGQVGPLTKAAMAKYGVDAYGNVTAPAAPAPPLPAPVAPEPTPEGILGSQNGVDAAASYAGPDLSGAMAALQGAQGAVQQPSSVLDQLTSLLGTAPSLPTMDIPGEANRQIDLKYGGQETALANQLKQLAASFAQGQQEQNLYGQKADTALSSIFSGLQNDLAAGQQRTGGYYDTASQQSGSSYDQAGAALQALNQSIMQQMGGDAQKLGIQEGMTAGGDRSPMARLMGNYQGMAGRNIQNKAISSDALSQNKANSLQLAETQRTGAGRQGAQARADVQSNVQGALAQLGLQNMQNVAGVQQQQTELARQKPLDLQGIISQLTQSQYDQQRQAQQDRLAEMTGLGGLDLKQQEVANSSNKQAQDLQIAMANLMGDQAKATSDYQLKKQSQQLQYNNPLDNLYKQAQISNMGTTQQLNQGRLQDLLNPQPKPTDATRYENLLQDFYQQPEQGLWGAGGAGPHFQDAVTALIKNADVQTATGGAKDPYQWAVANILDQNTGGAFDLIKKYGLNQQGIMDALRIYFKGGR